MCQGLVRAFAGLCAATTACLVVGAGYLSAQGATAEPPIATTVPVDPRLGLIRQSLVERVRSGDIPSVALAVSERSRLIWVEAIGWADLASGRAATPASSYLVGSLSKALTAAVALGEVEDGLVGLDDTVERWVSVTAPAGSRSQPTLRELLDSTGGLSHGWRSIEPPASSPTTSADWDRWLAADAFLAFPPGVVFEYSNLSFGVVARIAERAAGSSFDALIDARLFRPLAMTGSFARRDPARPNLFATPYSRAGKGFVAETSSLVPEAGLGMYASASDLERFGRSMLGQTPDGGRPALRPATLAMFWQPAPGPGRPFFHFGFWNTGRSVVANGSVTGANAHLALLSSAGVVVAVVVNATGSVADETADRIVEILGGPAPADGPYSQRAYQAEHRTPLHEDASLGGRWVGSIFSASGPVPVTLDASSNAIDVGVAGGAPARLGAASFNVFRELRGTIRPAPPGPWTDASDVAVVLRLEGNHLQGYVLPRGRQAIPMPATLTRVPDAPRP